jgi:hypothetical protein
MYITAEKFAMIYGILNANQNKIYYQCKLCLTSLAKSSNSNLRQN